MWQLLLGLFLFIGMHSISIVALPVRDKFAARSEAGWKIFYTLISIIGLILIVRGYADARHTPTLLYVTPGWLSHLSAVLLLPVFVLFIAPYFPGRISKSIKHPQLVGLILWALAHLLVNGNLADTLLFGTFLLWGIVDRISMRKRTSRPLPGVPESRANDLIVLVAGLAIYLAIVFWLHESLLGVRPFA